MEALNMCPDTVHAIAKADDHIHAILSKGLSKVSFPRSWELPCHPVFHGHSIGSSWHIQDLLHLSGRYAGKVPVSGRQAKYSSEHVLNPGSHQSLHSESYGTANLRLAKAKRKKKSEKKKKTKNDHNSLQRDIISRSTTAYTEDDFCNEPGLQLPLNNASVHRSFAAPVRHIDRSACSVVDSRQVDVERGVDLVGSLLGSSSYDFNPGDMQKRKRIPAHSQGTSRDDLKKASDIRSHSIKKGVSNSGYASAAASELSFCKSRKSALAKGRTSNACTPTIEFMKEDLAMKRMRLLGRVPMQSKEYLPSAKESLSSPFENTPTSHVIQTPALEGISAFTTCELESSRVKDSLSAELESPPDLSRKEVSDKTTLHDCSQALDKEAYCGTSLVIADVESEAVMQPGHRVAKRVKKLQLFLQESSDSEEVSTAKYEEMREPYCLNSANVVDKFAESACNQGSQKDPIQDHGCNILDISSVLEDKGTTSNESVVPSNRHNSQSKKAHLPSSTQAPGYKPKESSQHRYPVRARATPSNVGSNGTDYSCVKLNLSHNLARSKGCDVGLSNSSPSGRPTTRLWEREMQQVTQVSQKQNLIPCPSYKRYGQCSYEGNCRFSHDCQVDKRLDLCRYYAAGTCLKGESCPFMHGEYPCRFFHAAKSCRSGGACRFSHVEMTPEVRAVFEARLQYEEDLRESARALETQPAVVEHPPAAANSLSSGQQQAVPTVAGETSFVMPSLYYELT